MEHDAIVVHVHVDDLGVFAAESLLARGLRDLIVALLKNIGFLLTVGNVFETGRCIGLRPVR